MCDGDGEGGVMENKMQSYIYYGTLWIIWVIIFDTWFAYNKERKKKLLLSRDYYG